MSLRLTLFITDRCYDDEVAAVISQVRHQRVARHIEVWIVTKDFIKNEIALEPAEVDEPVEMLLEVLIAGETSVVSQAIGFAEIMALLTDRSETRANGL